MVACASGYGEGGMGAHLRQVVAQARSRGPVRYFCTAPAPDDPDGVGVPMGGVLRLLALPPVRQSPALRSHLYGDIFDRRVARRLPAADSVHAFSGQALHTFAAVGGGTRRALECPTAHVRTVARRHAQAFAAYPLERPWLGSAQIDKSLAEYGRADACWVVSRYAWESFLDAGVRPERLRRRRLTVDLDRWRPPQARSQGPLRVVYVGALSVAKGVPLLLDAFARLEDPDARLVLCGGCASRGMRVHLERCCARDPRVRLVQGDPLPHYQAASLYVHPSYQDGFGLAPLEAAACGLPLVLSADSGVGEALAGPGALVVPTGRLDALVDLLRTLARNPERLAGLGAQARAAAVRWVCGGEGDAPCTSATTSTV